ITAAQSGISGTSTVTVTAPTVTALTVTPATVSMGPGDSTVLTAKLTYSDGSTGPATAVAWTSSNSLVAAVDGAGTVTAVAPGTATITAAQSGISGTSTVTVTARPTTDPPVTETGPPPDGGNVIG
ncbi:MAG: Ig-like domain-containing protein, partial [Specibacter sp.]